MSFKPKVALAQDFLVNLATLSSAVQGKILKWALRFQSDPTSNGINYEPIHGARDKNLKSVRIDQDWRGIVFKPPAGDVYVLMYVDRHDAAYSWAEGRRIAVNPTTGALQVFAVESLIEPALEQARYAEAQPFVEAEAGTPIKSAQPQAPLFSALSDQDLLGIGTPQELLTQVRSIQSEAELDALQGYLPVEAYEGLFLVAAGDSVSEVLMSRETRIDKPVDVEDFAAAIETAESQARFVVVADEETMVAMLNVYIGTTIIAAMDRIHGNAVLRNGRVPTYGFNRYNLPLPTNSYAAVGGGCICNTYDVEQIDEHTAVGTVEVAFRIAAIAANP